jgi:hypothetical protein
MKESCTTETPSQEFYGTLMWYVGIKLFNELEPAIKQDCLVWHVGLLVRCWILEVRELG